MRRALILGCAQWQGEGGTNAHAVHRGAKLALEAMQRVLGDTVSTRTVNVPVPPAQPAKYPDRLDGVKFGKELMTIAQDATQILNDERPTHLFTAGGDCAVDLMSIRYLNQVHADLSVIYIDAHADLNTSLVSPSGNFHGMSLRALLGDCPEFISSDVPPLKPEQVILAGTREFDTAEEEFRQARPQFTTAFPMISQCCNLYTFICVFDWAWGKIRLSVPTVT